MHNTNPIARLFYVLLLGLGLLFSLTAAASPEIQHWTTDNGARVYFVAAPELPMVDIRVVFDAGSARDGKLPGLAMLTNGMLEEGAGKLNADDIAARFDSLGARFSANSERDMAIVSLRSLIKPSLLEPALDVFSLVLSQPSVPHEALERVRNQMLIGLQAEEQSPGDISRKAFYHTLYDSHPYGIHPAGTVKSIKAMSRKEVLDFHHRYYVGHNAVVAIVGAVTRDEAAQLAEKAVGALPAGKAAPALPPVPALKQAIDKHINYPSAQSHVLMGEPGDYRGDPDYFPLYVGNHILGGSGLVSRLSEEVREKRGLSYSVYSYFMPMRKKGPFILGLQTRTASTGEALKVLRQTLDKFTKEGPTEEELEAAKKNITGGFPLKIDSNSDILGYIAMIGFYRLPLNYLDSFNSRINAVTAAQIRDAFARRVHPDKMVTITVGAGE